MPHPVHRAGHRRHCFSALIGVLLLLVTPALGRAQDASLYPGGAALVAGGAEGALLRDAAGYDAAVVTPLGDGTPATILDGPYTAADGSSWYQVDVGGIVGYAPASALGGTAAPAVTSDAAMTGEAVADPAMTDQAAAPPVVDPAVTDPTAAPVADPNALASAPGPSLTTSDVNLRAAPDATAPVLATLPPGAALEITGAASNGYLPVLANGTGGWVAAEYVQAGAGAPAPELAAAPAPVPAAAPETAAPVSAAPVSAAPVSAALPTDGALSLVADANLRAEPDPEAAIIGSVPGGAPVSASGLAENGYTPVTYNGQFGWVPTDTVTGADAALAPGVDTTAAAPPAGGAIQWPFSGGTWQVIQGYNNGTHQNRSSFANYQYALDWARTDGETAGAPIAAPVSGTISWVDGGSGGILIDMGNGYGVAMFHLTIDGSLRRGQAIQAGQYVGVISGPGGPGYASTPHLDMTLWQLPGDGSHIATPFTGQFAIGGMNFPASGAGNEHMGVEVSP